MTTASDHDGSTERAGALRAPRPEPLYLVGLFLRIAGVPGPWDFRDGVGPLREYDLEKECETFVTTALLAHDLVTAKIEGRPAEAISWLRLTTASGTASRRVVLLRIVENAERLYAAGSHAEAVDTLARETGFLDTAFAVLDRQFLESELRRLVAKKPKTLTATNIAATLSIKACAFGDGDGASRTKVVKRYLEAVKQTAPPQVVR